MIMAKHVRLRNGRRKATFGIDGAITAAATLAAAGINAVSTANAAKEQSEAIKAAAQKNAEALKKQNENNNSLQEDSIAFTKEQNERNRDLQKEIQMNLQLLAGKQNTNEMKEAAKIQVKQGGSMRKRLRSAKTNGTYPLRGSNGNLPFIVTDGGGVIPIGTTPEGYDLYELIGNDHEHYHKTKEGKNKTGVGIRFQGNNIIEGEGNQNTNQGELMLVTPTDAKFISKHTIKGYNPREAVMNGQDPLEAFAIQEQIKDIYGISDDGKSNTSSPVRGMRPYGGLSKLSVTPDLSLDFLAPVATGIVAGTRQLNQAKYGRRLRCGGRHKAAYGYNIPPYNYINWPYSTTRNTSDWNDAGYQIPQPLSIPMSPTITRPTINTEVFNQTPGNGSTTKRANGSQGDFSTAKGNLIGAGISAGANLLAAGIGSIGNTIAARNLARGYGEAGDILADAYGRLSGIDMSLLNRDDFRSAHAMPALQAPIVNTSAERTAAERSLHRNLARINGSTLSSAAAQNRSARAETEYNDRIGEIEANADKIRQAIIQANMERITQVANENANRDTQANREFAQSYLNLLQYNNDIANERITGVAQARADALLQRQSTLANMRAANAQSFADAINVGGNSFANAFATNAKMRNELEMSRYGWTAENNLNWVIRHADLDEARMLYKRYKGKGGQYDTWAEQLENAFGKPNLV